MAGFHKPRNRKSCASAHTAQLTDCPQFRIERDSGKTRDAPSNALYPVSSEITTAREGVSYFVLARFIYAGQGAPDGDILVIAFKSRIDDWTAAVTHWWGFFRRDNLAAPDVAARFSLRQVNELILRYVNQQIQPRKSFEVQLAPRTSKYKARLCIPRHVYFRRLAEICE